MTGNDGSTGSLFLTIVLVVLGGAAAVSAQQSRETPYQKLFRQPSLEQTARQQNVQDALRQAEARSQRPRVVCGMTLLPANPAIDPKMAVEPRRDDTRYTIRAIEPPVCWIPESERK